MARRRSKLDYFPFFPKDCEADEAVRMMDDAQFGFWMRCLCFQWPHDSIPADPNALAVVLNGRAVGGSHRSAEYIAEMLRGPVGLRMKQHPTEAGRLADRRLLAEKEIALKESETNRKNRATKDGDFVEGKADDSCHDTLFCSVLNTQEKPSNTGADSQFEIFWSLYPKKASKPHALKAWNSHGKTAEIRGAIIAGLKAHLPLLKEWHAKGYCPNPATWLNGERWNDEVAPVEPAPRLVSTMDPEITRRLEERRRAG